MCYSSFRSRGVTEANSFLARGGANDFTATREHESDSVSLHHPRVSQATLAADILALVISAQPTDARPLIVTISVDESGLANYPAFRNAPGWKETVDPNAIELECEFVWDAAANKLTKGSVPLVQLEGRDWITPNPEQEKPGDDAEKKVAQTVASRIKEGIHDGTLCAEKVMPADQLHDSGLPREIGKGGYYEALATYSDGKTLPDKPQNHPVKIGDSDLMQARHAGWTIGIGRGEAIAIEVRNAIEEAKLKKEE